jgi:transcriptional regulator with GAF, ATPase, and Fis domain
VDLLRAVVTHLAVRLQVFRGPALLDPAPVHHAALSPAVPKWRLPSEPTSSEESQRLLRWKEVRPMLEEMVRMARDILDANLVVLYPREPQDGVFFEPIWTGELRTQVATADSLVYPVACSAVDQALNRRERFVEHAQADEELLAEQHMRETVPFIVREGIRSTAVLTLHISVEHGAALMHGEPLGVLFVDYREERTFPADYQRWCRAVAHLTALALRNTLLFQEGRTTFADCAGTWRDLHEDMAEYKRNKRNTRAGVMFVG